MYFSLEMSNELIISTSNFSPCHREGMKRWEEMGTNSKSHNSYLWALDDKHCFIHYLYILKAIYLE